jgi:hypothetical protein
MMHGAGLVFQGGLRIFEIAAVSSRSITGVKAQQSVEMTCVSVAGERGQTTSPSTWLAPVLREVERPLLCKAWFRREAPLCTLNLL